MRFLRPRHDIFPNTIGLANAGDLQISVEFSQIVDHPQFKQGGDHDNEPRSADPLGPDTADGNIHGLKGQGIHGKIFDCPFGGPHAEGDTPTFKCRTRRTSRAGQPVFVADNDLGIGSDIHVQRKFL